MGRRKQQEEEIVESTENLEADAEIVEEAEALSEELASEEEPTEVEATEEAREEKPKRQRRSRKKAEPTEVAAIAEETEVEAVASEPVEEEAVPEKPKRQSRRGKKQENTPEAQIELATDAMAKTMQDMVAQWAKVQEITTGISSQLDKVSHIVKPSIQEYVDTQEMLRPHNKPSFVTRFAIVASVIAVLFSLVSLSLSQSARQVALNAEATRVANSQLFAPKEPKEVAVSPSEAPRRTQDPFVGPRQRPSGKFRK